LKHFFRFLLFSAVFAGCEGEESLKLDSGAAYFPLRKGLYHIYQVNEVRYTTSAEPEDLNYEIMSEVIDSFPSAEGLYTYVMQRSRRWAADDPWEVMDTWSARIGKSELIVSEGNIPFVKMSFPIRQDARWDGNAFNAIGHDEYRLTDIQQDMEVGDKTFEKAITIEQERNEDVVVYNDQRVEMYALDVGLVYKEVIKLNYCTADNCLGQQKVNDGYEMKMIIKEYGG
jgi:hypothetical protein